MNKIELPEAQIKIAANVGMMRVLCSFGRTHRNGAVGCQWGWNIGGAIAEAAMAQWLGIPYDGSVNTFHSRPDVGEYEVRSTDRYNGNLIIRDCDALDSTIYILAITSDLPTVYLAGWITGKEAAQKEYIKAPDPSRPVCYFFPRWKLKPMEKLPLTKTQNESHNTGTQIRTGELREQDCTGTDPAVY
jgi:hypothetical protein